MLQRISFNLILAVEGVNANKLRSILTALGIVFGVGAVIAMLAIGTGAKKSILDQMKLIGTNNVIITPYIPSEKDAEEEQSSDTESASSGGRDNKWPYSPGLTINDLQAIEKVLSNVERVSPEVIIPTNVLRGTKLKKGRVVGVTNPFFELNRLSLDNGNFFHQQHLEKGSNVCIIGKNVQINFFSEQNPIGQKIKCGKTWLTIVGVLEQRLANGENLARLGIRDFNADVYVPVTTALLRFQNRAMVTSQDISNRGDNDGRQENYHQLDRAVIRVKDSRQLQASADVIARVLKRRHNDLVDYEIEIPELLLEQEQKTQETFNLVLAVIAGISLLVGGIGIMNIMLASVMERIKEIGVRRSLGATRDDIILQFLFEAVIISLIGGILGVLIGVASARTIASYADIPTVVSTWSIALSFGVAASIGLLFGLFPAQKAAEQDPIKALRSD